MGPLDSRPTFGILMKFISHSIFSNNWVEESYRFTVFPRVLVYKNFFEQIEFWSFSTFWLGHVFEIIWHSYYIFNCLSLTKLIFFTKSTSGLWLTSGKFRKHSNIGKFYIKFNIWASFLRVNGVWGHLRPKSGSFLVKIWEFSGIGELYKKWT